MAFTYDYIAQVSLASSTTFSGISSAYTDLRLVISTKSTGGGLVVRFNSDGNNNYTTTRATILDTGTTNNSRLVGNSGIILSGSATPPSGSFLTAIFDIFDYTNAVRYKTVLGQSGFINGTANGELAWCAGTWKNTNAITSIDIANITSPSGIATLYGIKAA